MSNCKATTQKQVKLVKSALRMSAKKGFNPYDSQPIQERAYVTLARMQRDCVPFSREERSEARANYLLSL